MIRNGYIILNVKKSNLFDATNDGSMLKSPTMGSLVGDSLIQKLMLGVLCKYFAMPLFDFGNIDFSSTLKCELQNITRFQSLHHLEIERYGFEYRPLSGL